LKSNGTVVSWGTYGLAQFSVPQGLNHVVAIATGDYHSVALKSDGTLVTWGFDTAGQINVPSDISDVVAIAARGSHNMVLLK
jgi:alpha-tubulin suppressor-like RCC1 family protein